MSGYDNLAREYRAHLPEVQQQRAPHIKHKRNPKPKGIALLKTIKYFAVAMLAFAAMLAMIYGKVELSKITNEQSQLQQQLAELQENNLSLESELESKTNIVKVEDYAENVLGLAKLNKGQIEYVELQDHQVIEVVEKDDDNFFSNVKKWFDGVLEYIGI
ncbi:MAG: hypothetical protein GX896_08600 [Clostridiales bacterium]|nr:hypothetical protein [Clostridiales bacterium]